nr:GNAT family N-acetyltransferase [Neptunicella marina]
MPHFGRNYLKKYYSEIIQSPRKDVLIYRQQNKVTGFIVLRTGSFSMTSILRLKDIVVFLCHCLAKPSLFLRAVIQTVRQTHIADCECEIDYFAVAIDQQGSGIGKALIHAAENWCRDKNIQVLLTKTNNARLQDFYLREKKAETLKVFSILRETYKVFKWTIE